MSKHYRAKICCVVGMIFAVAISMIISTLPTHAVNYDTLLRKAALAGLYSCYSKGAYKSDFALKDYTKAEWLVSNADTHTIYLPNGTTGVSNNQINCKEVLNGKSEGFWSPKTTFAGLYSLYGKSTPVNTSSPSDIQNFLKGMGYDSSTKNTGKCVRFTYERKTTITDSATAPTTTSTDVTTICANDVKDGKIAVDEMAVTYQRSTGSGATNNGSSDAIKIKTSSGKVICQTASVNFLGLISWKDAATITFQNGSTTWEDFQNSLLSNGCAPESLTYQMSNSQYNFHRQEITYPPSDQVTTQMTLAGNAGNRAVKYLSGMSYDGLKLTSEEKRTLLQYYLDDYYKIEKRCGLTDSNEIAIATGDGFIPAAIVEGGKATLCYIKPTAHQDDSVYVWDSNDMLGGHSFTNGFKGLVSMLEYQLDQYKEERKQYCNDTAETARRGAQVLLNQSTTSEEYREKATKVIEELDKILSDHGEYWYESGDDILCYEFTDINGQVVSPTPPPPVDDTPGETPTGTEAEEDPCNGTAGSLGWILCPVLNMISRGVDEIYDGYVQKQFLEINSTNLDPDTEQGSKVYLAWGTIRNIANIIFVILFMLVLFSQFTGVGLTNYGIKKMLPKLIIVSVLVNISFLLCQFAVDLSNILGYTMNSLFDSLGGTVSGLGGSFNSGSGAVAGWVSTLGLAIGASTVGAWLPTFLLAMLSAAISVFFGAIILAARQAGIYILIVLAPVAIVCYALPNAKKMFDRWFKIFTALLLVFPITGALMGGGNFASAIILGSGGFFLTLVGMLLRVVPFFMIPGLVKNAMAGLGNVGAKIAGIGGRVGGTGTGALRKSDGFQRFAEGTERLQARGINAKNRLLRRIPGIGKHLVSKGSERRVARAIGAQEARLRGDAKARAIASGGFISSGRAKDIMASAEDAEETQGIKDAENAYKLRTDMDAGNAKDMSKELEKRLNELEQNPENIEVRRKVKALTKILLESDDGRGALMEVAHQHAATHTQALLDANGNIDGYSSSEATKILGKYLGNGENMGKIKGNNQRGLQNLVKDINSSSAIQTANAYNAMGANKISANAVGGMDTTALAAQVRAAQSGDLIGNSLQQLASTYTRALTSENAANDVPAELVDNLNAIREAAYNEKMQSWLDSNTGKTAADYAAKFGAFTSLNPGDELRIQHTKAAVPTGFTEAGIWIGGGNGPTRQQQIAYDEWARHSAEIDRQNSQQP